MIEKAYTTYTEEGPVSVSSGPGGIYLSVKRTDLDPHEAIAIELSIENLRELIASASELLSQLEPPEAPQAPSPEPNDAPAGSVN